MRPIEWRFCALASAIAWGAVAGTTPARAQMAMPGSGRSLGGYGAATISSYYGGGGGGYLPYNGRASGFVPYRGNGIGGGMSTQPIPRRLPQTPIGGVMMAETPIGGASLSSGMRGGNGRGGAMGTRPESRTLVPFGYEGGIGMGNRIIGTPMTRQDRSRRATGPGFGYPFRIPPSLSGGSPSMAMP